MKVCVSILLTTAFLVVPAAAEEEKARKGQALGYVTKHIVENGVPEGPLTTVFEMRSGATIATNKEIAKSAEGKPLSGTVAIALPSVESPDVIVISLDKSFISGTKYENVELVVQIDGRNMRPLVGEGATYISQVGEDKVRLGNYYFRTKNKERQWIRVKMLGPSTTPQVDSSGVEITRVEGVVTEPQVIRTPESKATGKPEPEVARKPDDQAHRDRAYPIGGMRALARKIRYTEEAQAKGIQGKVIIQAILNEQGIVTSAEVKQGLGYGLDDVALNAVKTTKFKPAVKEGKPVSSKVSLPIRFQLQP